MIKHAGTFDHCGKCDADPTNDCVQDCKGAWGGPAKKDACGVCGGTGKGCKGCDGVVNSGKKVDKCGVCGGNSMSCSDCAGTPNGKATKDKCGKCDADPTNDCLHGGLYLSGSGVIGQRQQFATDIVEMSGTIDCGDGERAKKEAKRG